MAEVSTGTNVASFDSPSPDGLFRSKPVFNCNNGTFGKCMAGKKKYKKWSAYLRDSDLHNNIKAWQGTSYKNKQANFILRNTMTGEMVMGRSG